MEVPYDASLKFLFFGEVRLTASDIRRKPSLYPKSMRMLLHVVGGCDNTVVMGGLRDMADQEASMCARYWTSGWDIFAPTQSIVFHLWDRSYRPSFREIPDQSESRKRSRLSKRAPLAHAMLMSYGLVVARKQRVR